MKYRYTFDAKTKNDRAISVTVIAGTFDHAVTRAMVTASHGMKSMLNKDPVEDERANFTLVAIENLEPDRSAN